MKRLLAPLCLALLCLAGSAQAEDARELVPMPAPAREALVEEMKGNMLALNEILALLADGKVAEAGAVAEKELGRGAMGKHRDKPFDARPGAHMPAAMHQLGMDGHFAASEFAQVAKSGDRDKALALLPKLTGSCVACHFAYRTR